MTQDIGWARDGSGVVIPAMPQSSVVQGTAGAAATTIDLGNANATFTLTGAEDFYWLLQADAAPTGTVAATTGVLQPAMQPTLPRFSGGKRYVAIIQAATSGKVACEIHSVGS